MQALDVLVGSLHLGSVTRGSGTDTANERKGPQASRFLVGLSVVSVYASGAQTVLGLHSRQA